MTNQHNNNQGNRGVDPQPSHGNDNKGHQDNNPPTRPTKPAPSHSASTYELFFN
jgi:hypothetical protein